MQSRRIGILAGMLADLGLVEATEKYKSVSADGTDTDRMAIVPR